MQMVRTRQFVILVLVSALVGWASIGAAEPLKVHASNPRYFTDGTGKAVYLTGSHTWLNLQDITNDGTHFDFDAYLSLLEQHNHNFIRLWGGFTVLGNSGEFPADPAPWQRTGPGLANDGRPKWDFSRLNQAYFDRLRQRIAAARTLHIYVGINLFVPSRFSAWSTSPFNPANNVNGVNGDANGDASTRGEVETLNDPQINQIQEAYVQKVVNTVNDLDNVLYEICNECTASSIPWQYHMINLIKSHEAALPFQHPVGMSSDGGAPPDDTPQLYASPADWIAPGYDESFPYYSTDPLAADGRKVVILDSDHTHGGPADPWWIWVSFMRGNQPINMEAIQIPLPTQSGASWNNLDHPHLIPDRVTMGQTRHFADRLNLANVVPRGDLSSSGYCLANPGQEYLVYLPYGGSATVDLSGVSGTVSVEWFNPATGASSNGGTDSGGGNRSFTPPFSGDAVLYLKSNPGADTLPPVAPTGLRIQ